MSNEFEIHKRNGVPHRTDGPAVIFQDGTKMWYVCGVKHREKGPAVEHADGTKEWWIAGVRHREDGPAVEYADGTTLHCTSGRASEWFTLKHSMNLELFMKTVKPFWLLRKR